MQRQLLLSCFSILSYIHTRTHSHAQACTYLFTLIRNLDGLKYEILQNYIYIYECIQDNTENLHNMNHVQITKCCRASCAAPCLIRAKNMNSTKEFRISQLFRFVAAWLFFILFDFIALLENT